MPVVQRVVLKVSATSYVKGIPETCFWSKSLMLGSSTGTETLSYESRTGAETLSYESPFHQSHSITRDYDIKPLVSLGRGKHDDGALIRDRQMGRGNTSATRLLEVGRLKVRSKFVQKCRLVPTMMIIEAVKKWFENLIVKSSGSARQLLLVRRND